MVAARGSPAHLLCLVLIAPSLAAAAPAAVPLPEVAPPLPPDPGLEEALAAAQEAVAAARALAEGAAEDAFAAAQDSLEEADARIAEASAGAEASLAEAQQALADAQAALEEAHAAVEDQAKGAAEGTYDELQARLVAADEAVTQVQADVALALVQAGDEGCLRLRGTLLATPIVVWTSCNMGLGSGLDADTLDGLSSEDILLEVDEERAARIAADEVLHGLLQDEVDDRLAADDALRADLDAETAARIAAVAAEEAARLADIAVEQAARMATDDALQAALDAETAARIAALAAEEAARLAGLASEEAARLAADDALQADLGAETAARAAALAAEEATRALADDALQSAIDAEASARVAALAAEEAARMATDAAEAAARDAADASLSAGIGAEAIARAAADDALGARIDAEAAAVPDTAWAAVLARDGAGSGLDADRLDGLDSAQFIRSDIAQTATGPLTVQNEVRATKLATATDPDDSMDIVGNRILARGLFYNRGNTVTDGNAYLRGAIVNDARSQMVIRNEFGGPGGGSILFSTSPAGGSPAEAMRITPDRNVGIGTSNPQGRLDVLDEFIAGGNAPDKDVLVITASSKAFPSSDQGAADWSANGAFWASPMVYRSKRTPDGGGGAFPDNNYGELMLQGTSHGNQYNRGISLITTPNDATTPAIRMRVAPDGKVGIGTTNPTTMLEVTQDFRTQTIAGQSNQKLIISGFDNGVGGGRGLEFNAVQEGITFQTHNGGWASRMHIADDGKVSIGTVEPGARLNVVGPQGGDSLQLSDNAFSTLYVSHPALYVARIGVGGAGQELRFGDHDGGVDYMTIKGGGKVGIGTTAPGLPLDVRQGSEGLPASSGTTQNGILRLGSSQADHTGVLDFGTAKGAVNWLQGTDRNNLASVGTLALNPNGGPVGIGTTTPTSRLEVAGDVRVSGAGTGFVFADGTKQTTAAGSGAVLSEDIVVVQDAFDRGYLTGQWALSTTGNGKITFPAGYLAFDTIFSSGGDSVTVRSNRPYSVNDGALVFKAVLEAYQEGCCGIYGNAQPRGLAAGTDRNNAIEFITTAPNSVGCRTVSAGVVTQTNANIGSSSYDTHAYQIVARLGEVKFFVDGALVCTHTTNIPTVPLNLLFSSTDGGAGNVPINIDSASFEVRR